MKEKVTWIVTCVAVALLGFCVFGPAAERYIDWMHGDTPHDARAYAQVEPVLLDWSPESRTIIRSMMDQKPLESMDRLRRSLTTIQTELDKSGSPLKAMDVVDADFRSVGKVITMTETKERLLKTGLYKDTDQAIVDIQKEIDAVTTAEAAEAAAAVTP
jgi:hypothetical protein